MEYISESGAGSPVFGLLLFVDRGLVCNRGMDVIAADALCKDMNYAGAGEWGPRLL